ncbi:hypothetical protein C8R44DRAFT_740153 [Mycena epipterygia]|nr:hypothetical protein C8R44DRAFT_740153 [Mycena epipterygia]
MGFGSTNPSLLLRSGKITVYQANNQAAFTSAPGASYTGVAAYNPSALVPPPVPTPAILTTIPVQLQNSGTPNLGIKQKGSFLGFSIEMSVTNQLLGKNSSLIQVHFLNLLANIAQRAGSVMIRVGGNTQESAKLVDTLDNGRVLEKIFDASCSGFNGISDAVLWGLDYALQMAHSNFSGAMFHLGGQNVFYNPFTSPPTNQSTFHQWSVGPLYYSALVMAEALGPSNNSQVVNLPIANLSEHTPVYGIYENGTPKRVAAINFVDDPSGANDVELKISISGSTLPGSVKMKYLKAASVTFGGNFASDGRPMDDEDIQAVPCDAGAQSCTVTVPAPGFALVFLTDDATTEDTGAPNITFATTARTKTHNTATVAPSVLATSNGNHMSANELGGTSKPPPSAASRAQVPLVLATIGLGGQAVDPSRYHSHNGPLLFLADELHNWDLDTNDPKFILQKLSHTLIGVLHSARGYEMIFCRSSTRIHSTTSPQGLHFDLDACSPNLACPAGHLATRPSRSESCFFFGGPGPSLQAAAMAVSDGRRNESIPPPLSIETLAAWKNYPIPDPDAMIARPWLVEAEKELARMDDEIEGQELELRRSTLLSLVEVYRVALAPHKILPIDILREVFLCAVQASSPEPDLNSIVSRDPDTLDIRSILCRICSHWRTVALDTHNLWSNVRVYFPKNPVYLLKVLDIWFSRSGQYPLTLNLIGKVDDPRVIQQLTRYSHRFRFLSIHVDNRLITLPAGSVDLLEALELDMTYADSFAPITWTVFVGAPRLRCVTFKTSFTEERNVELCAIPWHQLTELYLHITFPLPSQLYSVLNGCQALSIAHLSISQFAGPVPIAYRNVALPRLRTLELNGAHLITYTTFLSCLELPFLGDLTLNTWYGHADGTISSVPIFPTLRRLSINAAGDDPMLLPWLRACPSAVEVWLPEYEMSEYTLDEIGNGSILPNLEFLTLDYAEPDALIPALEDRLRNPNYSTIAEVRMSFIGQLRMEEIDTLSDLLAHGVFLVTLDTPREEIRRRARLDFEAGTGAFTPPSNADSESDSKSESESESESPSESDSSP